VHLSPQRWSRASALDDYILCLTVVVLKNGFYHIILYITYQTRCWNSWRQRLLLVITWLAPPLMSFFHAAIWTMTCVESCGVHATHMVFIALQCSMGSPGCGTPGGSALDIAAFPSSLAASTCLCSPCRGCFTSAAAFCRPAVAADRALVRTSNSSNGSNACSLPERLDGAWHLSSCYNQSLFCFVNALKNFVLPVQERPVMTASVSNATSV
jgi:hypothetical protein